MCSTLVILKLSVPIKTLPGKKSIDLAKVCDRRLLSPKIKGCTNFRTTENKKKPRTYLKMKRIVKEEKDNIEEGKKK